jgi:hypothetical protein
MNKNLVNKQYKLFEVQLKILISEINKEGLDPESVKELIYIARQYINRRNKVKKLCER